MRRMTIERLTNAVTKLNDTAKALVNVQENVDSLQKSLSSMKDELKFLTDVLEDEFHDTLMSEVMKDDEL